MCIPGRTVCIYAAICCILYPNLSNHHLACRIWNSRLSKGRILVRKWFFLRAVNKEWEETPDITSATELNFSKEHDMFTPTQKIHIHTTTASYIHIPHNAPERFTTRLHWKRPHLVRSNDKTKRENKPYRDLHPLPKRMDLERSNPNTGTPHTLRQPPRTPLGRISTPTALPRTPAS